MELRLGVKAKLFTKLAGCVKFSHLIDMGEDDFKQLIHSIENDGLFKKLAYPDDSGLKIINFQRYPKTELSGNFMPLNENIHINSQVSPDVDSLIYENSEVVKKIEKIGSENFKKYFIYNETDLGLDEISKLCSLTIDDTKKIFELVNSLAIKSEFYSNGTLSNSGASVKPQFYKIGKVTVKDNECGIEFSSMYYAQGKYGINYSRLYEAQKKGSFTKNELKRISKLIKNMEWINSRKNLTYLVVKNILETQKDYFSSEGDENKLVPFSQMTLAGKLGIHRGSISRICRHKSMETPWGEEKVLKSFFPSAKNAKKEIIKEILSCPKHTSLTDYEIVNILKKEYNIFMSRRTVCQYRNLVKGAN